MISRLLGYWDMFIKSVQLELQIRFFYLQHYIMATILYLRLSECNFLQWSLSHFRSWSADIVTAFCAVKMNRYVALYYLRKCYRQCQTCWMSQITKFMGQHGDHLGPVGPRWAPCWLHEPSGVGNTSDLSCRRWHKKTEPISQTSP